MGLSRKFGKKGPDLRFLWLTSATRQALLGMHALALAGENSSNQRVGRVARKAGLPADALAKVFQLLARNGLLVSHRGPGGGYALAKRPAEITLAEIARGAQEIVPGVHQCLLGNKSCRKGSYCLIHQEIVKADRLLIEGAFARDARRHGRKRRLVMKKRIIVLALAAVGLGLTAARSQEVAPTKDTSLYPNDFGAPEIDVSGYPKEQREAYKLMMFKCAACHTPARPINAQYLELTAEEAEKAKKEDPEVFKDDKVTHVEDKVWSRFVKRMMLKPGCPVKPEDGKKIYQFLVYDGKIRKMGQNGHEFREARAKLIHEFKEHHPDAYEKVFGDDKASKTGK